VTAEQTGLLSLETGLLSLEGIAKRLGASFHLHDISLRLGEGEALGLLGPNGSGKTTVLNVVSGLLRPDKGTVFFRGMDVTGRRSSELAGLGMTRVFQRVRLLQGVSVRRSAELGGYPRDKTGRKSDSRVSSALEAVGLTKQAHLDAARLSYFEQRKLDLARVMCGDCRLCLFDEPTSGLSSAEREDFLVIVKELKVSGVSMVLVEHDLALIDSLCDRVLVLNSGAVAFEGDQHDFLQSGRQIWERI
jgi:branched-chain amino acid transport system ATP-binding protein